MLKSTYAAIASPAEQPSDAPRYGAMINCKSSYSAMKSISFFQPANSAYTALSIKHALVLVNCNPVYFFKLHSRNRLSAFLSMGFPVIIPSLSVAEDAKRRFPKKSFPGISEFAYWFLTVAHTAYAVRTAINKAISSALVFIYDRPRLSLNPPPSRISSCCYWGFLPASATAETNGNVVFKNESSLHAYMIRATKGDCNG